MPAQAPASPPSSKERRIALAAATGKASRQDKFERLATARALWFDGQGPKPAGICLATATCTVLLRKNSREDTCSYCAEKRRVAERAAVVDARPVPPLRPRTLPDAFPEAGPRGDATALGMPTITPELAMALPDAELIVCVAEWTRRMKILELHGRV